MNDKVECSLKGQSCGLFEVASLQLTEGKLPIISVKINGVITKIKTELWARLLKQDVYKWTKQEWDGAQMT